MAKKTPVALESLQKMIGNYKAVAEFLRNLADQAATQVGVHPEIVKSATLLRIFLENEVTEIRKQNPNLAAKEIRDGKAVPQKTKKSGS